MTAPASTFLLPDLVLVEDGWQRGVGVELAADGSIAAVRAPRAGAPTVQLPGRALLPGFVNTHSHAFQRAMRGRTHVRKPGGAGDDFWSWRESMYHVVTALDAEGLEAASAMAYLEMLRSGWTSVAEFHYLHHVGNPATSDGQEAARRVMSAARTAGIRQTLVRVAYLRAGFEQRPSSGQLHFLETSEEFADRTRSLASSRDGAQGWGIGAHSVRAVDAAGLERAGQLARDHQVPFHIHVAEQPREVSDCQREHGVRPVELLARLGLLDDRAILVHCNHLTPTERDLIAASGATTSICPTTEGDLGDGLSPATADPTRAVPAAGELRRRNAPIALGTDSQAVIDPFAELRALEHLERTTWGSRVRLEVASELLATGTRWGAPALGVTTGLLKPGYAADLIALDLEHNVLLGTGEEGLLAAILLSGGPDLVTDVWVAGEHVVKDRCHRHEREIRERFVAAMDRLWR